MAGSEIDSKHARRARRRTVARAFALATATIALAIGATIAATAASASSVIPTSGGGVVPLAVGSEDSVITTHLHNNAHTNVTSVEAGTNVHPAVSIQGLSGTPTGVVVIWVYSNGDCTSDFRFSWSETLVGGAVDASGDVFSSLTVRTRSIRVAYQGNATYGLSIGACTPIAFTKATPHVSLKIHDAGHHAVTSVPFIETVHAAASVSGNAGPPKNWFVVRGWANGTCSGTDYVFATKNVDADGKVDSVLPLGFDQPGIRSYKAHYSGDAVYNPIWTDCVAVTGTKLAPKLITSLHDASHDPAPAAALVGEQIHPRIQVMGGFIPPDGSIQISYFDDAACTVESGDLWGTVAEATADSASFANLTRATPGAASWRVLYLGNKYYKDALSGCLGQHWFAKPDVALSIHDGSHANVLSVFVGTKVHFRVAVSGDFGTPSGSVTVRISTSSSCASSTSLGSGGLSSGVLHDTSIDDVPSHTGTVWFQATYKGNGSYVPRKSACLPLQVKAVPATATPPSSPKPTAAPMTKPSAAASAAPQSTDEVAGSTQVPAASSEPSPSAAPSDASAATTGPGSDAAATDGAPAGGPVTPTSGDAAGDGSIFPIVAVLVALGLVALVGFWFGGRARRRREGPSSAG